MRPEVRIILAVRIEAVELTSIGGIGIIDEAHPLVRLSARHLQGGLRDDVERWALLFVHAPADFFKVVEGDHLLVCLDPGVVITQVVHLEVEFSWFGYPSLFVENALEIIGILHDDVLHD